MAKTPVREERQVLWGKRILIKPVFEEPLKFFRMGLRVGTGCPVGLDDYPFTAVMHKVITDPDQVLYARIVRVILLKERFFPNFQDLLVFVRQRGAIKVILVLPFLPDSLEQCLVLFIGKEIRIVRRIGPELVDGGLEECNRREDSIQDKSLVPEALLRGQGAGCGIFFFELVPNRQNSEADWIYRTEKQSRNRITIPSGSSWFCSSIVPSRFCFAW